MKKVNSKILDIWNKSADSEGSMAGREDHIISGIVDHPESAFHRTTWDVIKNAFPVLADKRICVPSSGGNEAVFAFAALGAHVVSCDICEKQLKHASRIADKFKLNIEFIVQDTMTLCDIEADSFDLVYTSEGVHVWIDDLNMMYDSVYRILKKGGTYINYEIHPICRPFKDELGQINIVKPYESTGPFHDGTNYHWRLQDILNSMAQSGLVLKRLEEMHDEKDKGHFWFYQDKRKSMSQEEIDAYYDWTKNPLAALPQWFTVQAVKI